MSDENQRPVSPAELQKLYDLMLALIEKAARDLFRDTLEALRDINPKLEVVAQRCRAFTEILVQAGEKHAQDMSEAIHAIQEAAEAVATGDERNITACASHLEDFLERFRPKAKVMQIIMEEKV